MTAADVLHSFAMPSFGFKIDAVPGRLNETWFKAEREGVYYGQCSELCGNGHPYMPIADPRGERGRLSRPGSTRPRRSTPVDGAATSSSPRPTRAERASRRAPKRASEVSPWHYAAHADHADHHHAPTFVAAVVLFHEPQGHRHALPDLLVLRRASSAPSFHRHAHGAAGAGAADISPTRRPTTCS